MALEILSFVIEPLIGWTKRKSGGLERQELAKNSSNCIIVKVSEIRNTQVFPTNSSAEDRILQEMPKSRQMKTTPVSESDRSVRQWWER